MLKLKLQYCGHLMRRVDSLEKTLMLGGIRGRRRKDAGSIPGLGRSPGKGKGYPLQYSGLENSLALSG